MGLKKRLFIQNISVILITAVITISAGFVYGKIYESNTGLPDKKNELVAMVAGDEVLYKSEGLSEFDVLSAVLEADAGKRRIQIDESEYFCSVTDADENGIRVLEFEKVLDFSGYYKGLLICIVSVFSLVYLIASFVMVYLNKKLITDPITSLKCDAERLSRGELEGGVVCDGAGELSELCLAMEQLRLKLLESVYYKEKYDDNRKFLISGISHDLKTPVTAIRGYIEGVLDGVVDTKERRKKYLKAALLKTDIIKNMIDDLLLYSKLDLNQIPFDIKTVNIYEYMKDCVAESAYGFELEKKKLVFMDGAEKTTNVNIDVERFRRVIVNVFDNAKKHIREGTGRVEVNLRENNSSVIIEISDNGNGVKKENLANIFNRFYRVESARASDGSSGLGLTIAKQIVEGLGGIIWARSEESKGFAILISLRKAEKNEENFNY